MPPFFYFMLLKSFMWKSLWKFTTILVKPLLFFSEVSSLVFFHLWTRTCSFTTRFKLISFLSNKKAYCILSSPCKKGVIAICIEKYQHVKIWWWQVDTDHQNFVMFSVVRTHVQTDFFMEEQHFHIFIMRWNRWNEYPYLLTLPLQQSEFTVLPQTKSSQNSCINNFICCRAHLSILLPTSSPKYPERYWDTSSLQPSVYRGTFLINKAAGGLS
jgi:hypothetical protein